MRDDTRPGRPARRAGTLQPVPPGMLAAAQPNAPADVDIVVPARDEADVIAAAVGSLLAFAG